MQAHNPRHGINTYHSHKQRILGNSAAQPAPAWRATAKVAAASGSDPGSKILLSKLPPDVVENEVEILFSKTVGPVKEVLMVYNSQGKSRGMAVVAFTRSGDAAVARVKYNGKIVDGRRPIKIEIVTDEDGPRKPAPLPAPAQPTLLARIGKPTPAQAAAANATLPNGKKMQAQARAQAQVAAAPPTAVAAPKNRIRQKQGARRLKKQRAQQNQEAAPQQQKRPKPKTREELDMEIDQYQASADTVKVSDSGF